ncbi:MAG: histidine phosphatase family protein [Jannaschia helgolandensis]
MPPVYLMRHGETVWNLDARMQGQRDSPLTVRGRAQAARQGAILRDHGVTCHARSSPLGRAMETARLAGLEAIADARLAEVGMGAWEGRLRADITTASGLMWKFDAPGGEGLAMVRARLEDLLADDMAEPVILITHGAIGIVLRALLCGFPAEHWDRMEDPQGVVHVIENGVERLLA